MRFLPLAALVLAAGCYQIAADVTGLPASAGQESFAGAGDAPRVDAACKTTGADGSVTLPIAIDADPALLSAPLPIEASLRFVAPATAWSMRADAVLTVHGHTDLHP